ncbi:Regulatory protein RecX [invertebrate metagenome]|uniref:Regulatory protein RecX n=1 Tax=invertebrate metagenome TaxID=1711999 RepID=A0A2H9TAL0_9ZZZZ
MSDKMETAEYPEVRRSAMNYLAAREHAFAELKTKLIRRYPSSLVETVLTDLQQESLLSDERYAEMLVRSRMQRGYGPVRLKMELAQKGIRDVLAETALSSVDDWYEQAVRVREKKFGTSFPVDQKEKARQYRFMAQRGFTSDQISYAMSHCVE